MATSTGKTAGLIILIVVVLFLGLRALPLMFVPLGVFPRVWHTLETRVFDNVCFRPFGFFGNSWPGLLALVMFIVWVMVIVWVYRDAERRGMNGVLWALLVFIGNLVGLLIYLIIRSENRPEVRNTPAQVCPQCANPVGGSHVFCPHCGERLHPVCPKCRKAVEKEWRNCPYCGEKLT